MVPLIYDMVMYINIGCNENETKKTTTRPNTFDF